MENGVAHRPKPKFWQFNFFFVHSFVGFVIRIFFWFGLWHKKEARKKRRIKIDVYFLCRFRFLCAILTCENAKRRIIRREKKLFLRWTYVLRCIWETNPEHNVHGTHWKILRVAKKKDVSRSEANERRQGKEIRNGKLLVEFFFLPKSTRLSLEHKQFLGFKVTSLETDTHTNIYTEHFNWSALLASIFKFHEICNVRSVDAFQRFRWKLTNCSLFVGRKKFCIPLLFISFFFRFPCYYFLLLLCCVFLGNLGKNKSIFDFWIDKYIADLNITKSCHHPTKCTKWIL